MKIKGKYIPDLEDVIRNPIYRLAQLKTRYQEMVMERQTLENKVMSLASKELYLESKIRYLEQEYNDMIWHLAEPDVIEKRILKGEVK